MAMNTVINTNIRALTAHRNLGTVGNKQNKANQRLSSGKKINSAADDAAGLAISEKMKAQIKGLDMASKNSEDAISLIQTAEGSLTEVNNMLTRVRELTVQAANGTNQTEDREKIAEEVAQLLTEIDSISKRTEFNEKKLNDGSFKDEFFQIGANQGQSLNLSIGAMDVKSLSLDAIKSVFGIQGGGAGAYVDTDKIEIFDEKGQAVTVPTANEAGKKHKIEFTVGGVTANEKHTGTVTYIDANGDTKEVSFTYNVADVKGAAAAMANALKETELADLFDITPDSASGKVTLEAKSEGKTKVQMLGLTSKTDTALNASASVTQAGEEKFGSINLKVGGGIKDGYTIKIGGKTYTCATSNPENVENGFKTEAQLKELLEKDGMTLDNPVDATQDFTKAAIKVKNEGYISAGGVAKNGKDYSNAIKNVDDALKMVTKQRANLGANQNRLEYTINNLNVSSENLSAAKSRIEDTDMAKEMMNLTAANVLQQAATSMLAQANQAPQQITQLLG